MLIQLEWAYSIYNVQPFDVSTYISLFISISKIFTYIYICPKYNNHLHTNSLQRHFPLCQTNELGIKQHEKIQLFQMRSIVNPYNAYFSPQHQKCKKTQFAQINICANCGSFLLCYSIRNYKQAHFQSYFSKKQAFQVISMPRIHFCELTIETKLIDSGLCYYCVIIVYYK